MLFYHKTNNPSGLCRTYIMILNVTNPNQYVDPSLIINKCYTSEATLFGETLLERKRKVILWLSINMVLN